MLRHRLPLVSALCLGLGLFCAIAPAAAQAPSPQLNAVLAQMDAASRNFTSATANFEWDFTEHVAGMTDTTVQRGAMYIERGKSGTSFGATVFEVGQDGKTAPTPSKIISYGDGAMRVYTPAEKQEDLFKAGANQARADSFLTLGFGGSGHDLASAWQVTDGGPQMLSDGGRQVKTEKLVLVSKDPAVRNTFKQVTIWIDPTRDISLKQVFNTPSGDQRTATYRDIRLNGHVDKKPFEIPKKGVSVIQH